MYTLTEAIETMQKIVSNPSAMAGSLYSATDVLNILQSIKQTKRVSIPAEWRDNFIHNLTDDLDEHDIIDHDSAEFELYHNEIRLESISVDTYNLRNQLERRLSSALEYINSEIEYQETRERENAEMEAEAKLAPESDDNC